eukprot:m.28866 g.28866  ORF g.28866 m.28866 type:complete len:581 (+) comp4553_c0_seq1:493-2235(+)
MAGVFRRKIADAVSAVTGVDPGQVGRILIRTKGADFSAATAKLINCTPDTIHGHNPRDNTILPSLTTEWAADVRSGLDPDEIQVSCRNNQIMFDVNPTALAKATLVERDTWRRAIATNGVTAAGKAKRVVVEFSSPNIAKPFHAGHLRSTIIGGYLSRLYEAHGHTVHRINYLGDWGKQFGLLGVGFQRFGDRNALAADPIRHLFDVYVATNAAADNDGSIHDEARRFFANLEAGTPTETALWQQFRDLSVESYTTTYARLGVHFDEVAGESWYSAGAQEAVRDLTALGATEHETNSALLADLTASGLGKVLLQKADGSTVYITRDIAAAVDRYNRIAFDEMLYVAGKPQELHFKQLFALLAQLAYRWCDMCQHVAVGEVRGMSTRKGTVVFLQDILDQAQSKMAWKLKQRPVKTDDVADEHETAEAVGLACVVVQDLKSRRIKGYDFNWDAILNEEGDTGAFLMYTHARLCGIARISGVKAHLLCNVTLLGEPEAQRLIDTISRYEEALNRSLEELEPSVLVQYLFVLARHCSKAIAILRVKGAPSNEVAEARALLFDTARQILADGLRLLGLTPLERM